MTEEEFRQLYLGASEEVADKFYPKVLPDGPNPGRGEYLRDQAVLFAKLVEALKRARVIT